MVFFRIFNGKNILSKVYKFQIIFPKRMYVNTKIVQQQHKQQQTDIEKYFCAFNLSNAVTN